MTLSKCDLPKTQKSKQWNKDRYKNTWANSKWINMGVKKQNRTKLFVTNKQKLMTSSSYKEMPKVLKEWHVQI